MKKPFWLLDLIEEKYNHDDFTFRDKVHFLLEDIQSLVPQDSIKNILDECYFDFKHIPKSTRTRISLAVAHLWCNGIYPSGAKVAKILGRRNKSLKGSECIVRRDIMRAFGIPLRSNQSPKSRYKKCNFL